VVDGPRPPAHGRFAALGIDQLFAYCLPGQEDATFERMKKLIVASAPEFQLIPRQADAASAQGP